jgi:serpin B
MGNTLPSSGETRPEETVTSDILPPLPQVSDGETQTEETAIDEPHPLQYNNVVPGTAELTHRLTPLMLEFCASGSDTTVQSPFGLLSVLLPLLGGLSGKTLEEICLMLDIREAQVGECIRNITEVHHTLRTHNDSVKCSNVLLSRDTFPLRAHFVDTIKDLCLIDTFDSSTIPQLVNDVNALVETNTNGKITQFLQPADMDANTLFILLNTIHFSSDWKTKFQKSRTEPAAFYGTSKKRTEKFMMRSARFPFHETVDYQILKMPFLRSEFSFLVVLPSDKTSKPLMHSVPTLLAVMQNAVCRDVKVTLPKFTVEKELNLIPFLQHLGVDKLFFNMQAYKMTSNTDTKYISVLKQKIKVDVNEDGAEASAATVAVCVTKGCAPRPKSEARFVADHPFTYYIVYEPLQLVLFSGTYA